VCNCQPPTKNCQTGSRPLERLLDPEGGGRCNAAGSNRR
jgi:hypothetical protein